MWAMWPATTAIALGFVFWTIGEHPLLGGLFFFVGAVYMAFALER